MRMSKQYDGCVRVTRVSQMAGWLIVLEVYVGFGGTQCSVGHGVQWDTVFSGIRCSVGRGVQVFSGPHGVQWDTVFSGTRCSVGHGD